MMIFLFLLAGAAVLVRPELMPLMLLYYAVSRSVKGSRSDSEAR